MILLPSTIHSITWQKQNLADTATYYPQAVIKDKKGDTTLATLDLSSLGSDRYGVSWKVPQDPTGLGREISIIITIYENEAQTVVSGIYGAWETDYTIYELKPLGAGVGTSVDYKYIAELIREEIDGFVKKIPEPAESVEQEMVDLSELVEGLGEVKQSLKEKIKEIFNLGSKTANLTTLGKNLEKLIIDLQDGSRQQKKEMGEVVDQYITRADEKLKSISVGIDKDGLEVIKKINDEVDEAIKKIRKVINQETDEAKKKFKQQIFKQITVALDSGSGSKDERVNKLLPYVRK